MTIWTPDLTPFDGPLYLKLVKAIEQAIHDGTLPPRTRLPTHRALADRLGVTVGTITRAYGEAARPAGGQGGTRHLGQRDRYGSGQ
ncbi:hypothetical protein LMBIIBHN_03489 [Aeromonas salmonicida]